MQMYMSSKIRLFSLSVLVFCAAGSLRAQQAQSIAAGPTQPPEVKEFQGYEDQWSTAVVKADQYGLENLLSPLYVDISATGEVTTRNQQIAELFVKDGSEPVSMEQKVVSVRTFGDTAIVSGTYIVRYKSGSGLREERGIFTHVYDRQRNHWACVNAQRTAVVDLTPGKQQKAQKSDAPLPFHIPLFHQGAQSTQPATAGTAAAAPPN
jgi:ketosteroid isomerase-like protein